MNIILLSGGSGKRLWPLSNDVRSKQFIKIFKTENLNYESMVQRVYRQILSVDPNAEVTIATSRSQISSICNQLGEQVGISVEPCRRDTFPAIVLASLYLKDVKGVDLQEPVVVCPVDPYVENSYFTMLERMCEQVCKDEANLVLLGIEPTYPSEKYGYIIPQTRKPVSAVGVFKEKPSEVKAKEYIRQGALWNGGVFAYRLGYLVEKAHELFDFTDYYDMFGRYAEMEKISFDYAVAEKERRIQVIRYNGTWKDLGTWNTLTDAMEEQVLGKGIMDDTCSNVHVINELGIPVLAMGLENVVIAASPDGILVSDKNRSSFIKPYADQIHHEIMFAEKSWGSYRVLDLDEHSMTIKVTLHKDCCMNYHSHQHRNELWCVLSGSGHAVVDGKTRNVCVGDVVTMQAGCRHTIFADEELTMIEVQLGEEISVQDKQKFALE